MSDGPYTEGWPKKQRFVLGSGTNVEVVVPLSDAERMRKALEELAQADQEEGQFEHLGDVQRFARVVLNPERGK